MACEAKCHEEEEEEEEEEAEEGWVLTVLGRLELPLMAMTDVLLWEPPVSIHGDPLQALLVCREYMLPSTVPAMSSLGAR